MRFKFWVLLFGILFSATVVRSQIDWEKDYTAALKIAKETNKPMLLAFSAAWCLPCRKMEQTFWNRADVRAFSTDIVFVKFDFDSDIEIRDKYGVKGVPNVVFTDSWGEVIDTHIGFGQNADKVIVEKMTNLPKNFAPLSSAGADREKEPRNLDANYEFAEFYRQKKLYSYSNRILQKILIFETEPAKRENTLIELAFNHLRLGQSSLALEKLNLLKKEFPASKQFDKFIYGTILAQINKNNLTEAEANLVKLRNDFPQSDFVAEAGSRLKKFKERQK